MNVVQSLCMCYKGLARTRSTFKDPKYQQLDHARLIALSNDEINGVLLNALVRVKSKAFFCVQLRIDDLVTNQRYYVGINRIYENICVAYIHKVPPNHKMSAYIWEKDTRLKDLSLEVIRQALLKADEANLIALAPYQAFPTYYDDPVAADDGNCDKAS